MAYQNDIPASLYREVFAALPSPCLLLKADDFFTIVDVSDAYLRETSSDRGALVGLPVFEAFPDNPNDAGAQATELLGASLKRVVKSGRTDAMALQKYDVPDRSEKSAFIERYWSPVNVPIFGEDGSVKFILHRVENVTDFVVDILHSRSEDTVDPWSYDHLESESELIRRSRQSANANVELRRVSDEAMALAMRLEEEGARKDEFLAMLGHELRNPLAGVASAFEVMRRCGDNQHQDEKLAMLIERQITTLTRLVDDLLDASRVSRGAIRIERRPVDLRLIAETAAYSVRQQFDAKRHALKTELSPGDYTLLGDATRLQQVITNLLSNAIKYTEPGGVISLKLSTHCSGGVRTAVFEIEDNGRGIPRESLETIFELFSQVEATLDRSEGGLGIGLHLARRLVELHDGTVQARSQGKGMGSCFIVELPLTSAKVSESESSNEQEPVQQGDPIFVQLIEDDDDVRFATAALLETLGYKVATASDGENGFHAIQSSRPIVAIVDLGLPGIDGFAVARRTRDELGSARPFMIALSGYSGQEVTDKAISNGFDEIFSKPVNVEGLQNAITGYLRSQVATGPNATPAKSAAS